MCWPVDEDVVTRSSQEARPVFPEEPRLRRRWVSVLSHLWTVTAGNECYTPVRATPEAAAEALRQA